MPGDQPSLLDPPVATAFSPCGRYRYSLRHRWGPGPAWMWVMLNPSIAGSGQTGDDLDPTLRRCCGFAQAGGAGTMVICNLFALVGTDPSALRGALLLEAREAAELAGPRLEWLPPGPRST